MRAAARASGIRPLATAGLPCRALACALLITCRPAAPAPSGTSAAPASAPAPVAPVAAGSVPAPDPFWVAVSAFDLPAAVGYARTLDERLFLTALTNLADGNPDAAAVAFRALRGSDDATLRAHARSGVVMALSWHSEWAELAQLAEGDAPRGPGDPPANPAGVEAWARAFARAGSAVLDIPAGVHTLPLIRSAFGTPIVTVTVNGKSRHFWLDTGASLTLIAADVAEASGVKHMGSDTLALSAIGGTLPAVPTVIERMTLGPVTARGLHAAIIAPDLLRLDARLENGVRTLVKIDGVIGTDIIRRLDVTIDTEAGTVTLRRPTRKARAARNLYWVGFPAVRVRTTGGRAVLLGLDTGAESTFVTRSLLGKLNRPRVLTRRGVLTGLGSEREVTEQVVTEVELRGGGPLPLRLRNVKVVPERRWTFLQFDGMLGSDIALAARVRIDFTQGVFEVRRSAGAALAPSPAP